MEEEYPQLFHDEDSLFKPDDMFDNDQPTKGRKLEARTQ